MSDLHAATPASRLRQRIRQQGPVPFAHFMEEALYGEGGYYARPEAPIGEAGDFITGSSVSPLFARTTHRLLRRLDSVLDGPAEMLEVGYGNGLHLAEVAAAATGDGRRLRGVDRVMRQLPSGVDAAPTELLTDLHAVEDGEVDGLIFAYELFDALAVHRLIALEGGELGEMWVRLDDDEAFAWETGPLTDPALERLLASGRDSLEPGQIADLAPGWTPLYRQLASKLGRGLLVVCDYGFERHRLLDPRVRRAGTLACYSRHRVHRNPLVSVGEQDLTAHVDFTALREAGEAEGLETIAFTRQARWLTACGLFSELETAGGDAARRQAMRLLDGEGMGEELRVLVQGRGVVPGELLPLDILSG